MDAAIASLVSRLETVTHRLEFVEKQLASGSTVTPTPTDSVSTSAFVQQYEVLIKQFIIPYVTLSKGIDSVVGQQADLVLEAVNAQRDFLQLASSSKKPSDDVLKALFNPTNNHIESILKIKESNRTNKFFNNLSAVSEGIAALCWVLITPTPGPHVADMRGGAEFYSNRILKEFKGKDQNQVDWVGGFIGFLKELQNYIKTFHTTGVTWNPRGENANVSSLSSGSSAPAPPGPPPPGPPPAPMELSSAPSQNKAPDMSNLFAELSKGEAITSGLKKVTKDMKTKNRTDNSSIVPSTSKQTETSTKQKTTAPTKPAKLALEGNKWVIENQVNNKEIILSDTEVKQTVYIYKCKGSVIQIKGKVNAVTVDDCSKTGVVFENVVASFEIVNCNSVEVQVLGKVPSIAIDKTSGCQVYLSKESLETEIVTSKSSEMNISFPSQNADQDIVEFAVPEQYKSFVRNGKLVTEIVQHV
jgi:adenylyl cyclase-associated protein